MTNTEAKEIYEKFGKEKVIGDVKEKSKITNYMKSNIWILPALILLGIIIFMTNFNYLNSDQKVITIVFMWSMIIVLLCATFSQIVKISYSGDKMIVEDGLKKKQTLYLSKKPKIYIKHEVINYYDSAVTTKQASLGYYLYIDQNNNPISLNIKLIGEKRLMEFLNNLTLEEDIKDGQLGKNDGATKKTHTYADFVYFLDRQEQIIGIKNAEEKIEIKRDSKTLGYILFVLLFGLVALSIYLIDTEAVAQAIYSVLASVLLIVVLAIGRNNYELKVTYPQSGLIKINNYNMYYKRDKVMINIKKDISESTEHFKYMLIINDGYTRHGIDLIYTKEEDIEKILRNLIFKPRQ